MDARRRFTLVILGPGFQVRDVIDNLRPREVRWRDLRLERRGPYGLLTHMLEDPAKQQIDKFPADHQLDSGGRRKYDKDRYGAFHARSIFLRPAVTDNEARMVQAWDEEERVITGVLETFLTKQQSNKLAVH